jgi:exo-beta-1,3-glucanase (GH17 family)
MSYRAEKLLNFKNIPAVASLDYLEDADNTDLNALFREIINAKVHGFCYSLYEDGQGPGTVITEPQIRRRMNILGQHTNWVRSFSCIEGNEFIPKVAKEMGLKTLVGAWLGDDKEKNEEEIEALIKLAQQGLVDIAAVGNEVLYRDELSEDELIAYIERVKEALPGIPVGYVDAYYEFDQRPRIAAVSDVILCNCYPFWEGTPHEHAFNHMKHMYNIAKTAAAGKPVIITETGWPTQGTAVGGAQPSMENALKYFLNTQLWSNDEDVEIFYFASFDESWKVGSEGDVGAYWGIWDKNEQLKF